MGLRAAKSACPTQYPWQIFALKQFSAEPLAIISTATRLAHLPSTETWRVCYPRSVSVIRGRPPGGGWATASEILVTLSTPPPKNSALKHFSCGSALGQCLFTFHDRAPPEPHKARLVRFGPLAIIMRHCSMSRCANNGREQVQQGEAKRSLDDLVGACEQLCWHLDAERLGGFQIDHKLVLRRLLNGHVRRVCAPEDSINVGR
jgi:hypothetical protein